jgi:two-component system response regulator VanR
MRVLIAEDEPRVGDAVARGLRREGMAVDLARDGETALRKALAAPYDVVVLDRDLPALHGDDVCRTLAAERPQTKVLMLTAAGGVDDLVDGFALGADDYLPKPFEPRELLARIRTVLRRAPQPSIPPLPRVVRFGNCMFDLDRQLLTRSGVPIRLTSTEAALLRALALSQGRPLTRESLSEGPGQSRTVDVQVTRLRRKIEDDPKFPRYLQTVRGKGYVLLTD